MSRIDEISILSGNDDGKFFSSLLNEGPGIHENLLQLRVLGFFDYRINHPENDQLGLMDNASVTRVVFKGAVEIVISTEFP